MGRSRFRKYKNGGVLAVIEDLFRSIGVAELPNVCQRRVLVDEKVPMPDHPLEFVDMLTQETRRGFFPFIRLETVSLLLLLRVTFNRKLQRTGREFQMVLMDRRDLLRQ